MGLLRWVLFGLVLRRFKWLGLALAGFGLLRRVTDGRNQSAR
jgi:hypothetical protein